MSLKGRVALVAGATRGAGRGIAVALGEAGAVVYCSGRSSRERPGPPAVPDAGAPPSPFDLSRRPETIEETAERVTAAGGLGVPVRADHSDPAQVAAVVERIWHERGRLDILVNDIWGGDALAEWGVPFWELSLDKGLRLLEGAIHTHIITSRLAVPLVLEGARGGLVVEITDGDDLRYRGNLFYDLAKVSVIRLAVAMGQELRERGVAAVAVTPGFLRSEAMLEHFGVTEANWRDGALKDPHFIASETPLFVGRAVAALAADPAVLARTGRAFSSWGLAREYGFPDADGSRPDWGRHFEESGLA